MALKDRKNKQPVSISDQYNEKENPFLLSQRQLLIGRLADLQYQAQRKKLSDEKISEILKLLSHV
jgi:hypothetical protein